MIIKQVLINDSQLFDFRKKVIYEDCKNFPSDVLENKYKFNILKNIVNNETFEDGYRFTYLKFIETEWYQLLGQFFQNEMVAFSGSILHDRYLKVGVFHYFLKKYRHISELRGSLFRKDGFIDTHIKLSSFNINLKGVFFTVYTHNKQLQRYVNYLKEKKFVIEKHDMFNLKLVQYGGIVTYKQIEQHLFYIPLNNFNLDELKLLLS